MANELLLLAYGLPAVPIWAAYAMARRGRSATHARILDEANEAGLMEPPSLHPVVDTGACFGCGACALACHEVDVLGLIDEKAVLIDPTLCVGHGACASACPVGAITLVYGTETRGIDIPIVSPDFETNVPGVYIAGELGGMGLIRNAVEQGHQAMNSIITAAKAEPAPAHMLDVLVVGAGPAGISASLAAMEAGIRVKTIEQDSLGGTVAHFPRGKVVMTAPAILPIYGKMDFREVSKEQLIELWTEVVETTGVPISYGERVASVETVADGFWIETDHNFYLARRVLLATGRRGTPRTLDIPGEELSKVVYRLVDAQQYTGKHVVVVGGGDSAIEAALALSQNAAASVALVYRGSVFNRARRPNREEILRVAELGRLTLFLEAEMERIEPRQVRIRSDSTVSEIDNDAVIICAGGILPNDFLRSVGISVETKYGTT